VQHLLPQVEVLLHVDGEVAFLLVRAGDLHLVELNGLLEGERGQVDPHLLVLQAFPLELPSPRELLTC
jgi:hypothetical protein